MQSCLRTPELVVLIAEQVMSTATATREDSYSRDVTREDGYSSDVTSEDSYSLDVTHSSSLDVSLATLAALAVTCRSVHEPTISVLWRRLRGLEPLLACIPEDVFTNYDERVNPCAI